MIKNKVAKAIMLEAFYRQALEKGVTFKDREGKQLKTTREIFQSLQRDGYVQADVIPPAVMPAS